MQAEWLLQQARGERRKLTGFGDLDAQKLERSATLLSRIPSEEATEEEIEAAILPTPYIPTVPWLIKVFAKAGLRITRTPGRTDKMKMTILSYIVVFAIGYIGSGEIGYHRGWSHRDWEVANQFGKFDAMAKGPGVFMSRVSSKNIPCLSPGPTGWCMDVPANAAIVRGYP